MRLFKYSRADTILNRAIYIRGRRRALYSTGGGDTVVVNTIDLLCPEYVWGVIHLKGALFFSVYGILVAQAEERLKVQ